MIHVVAPAAEYSDGLDELQGIGLVVVVGHLEPAGHFVHFPSPSKA